MWALCQGVAQTDSMVVTIHTNGYIVWWQVQKTVWLSNGQLEDGGCHWG